MTTNNAWNTPDLTTDGQLLIGQTGGRPLANTLTAAGSHTTITNGSGTITIATISDNGNWIQISTATAANDTSVDFTGLSATYHIYKVIISNLQPITDSATFRVRTSTDNGVSFDSGASDYQWQGIRSTTSSNDPAVDNSDSEIELTRSLGNSGQERCSMEVTIFNPSNTEYTKILGNAMYLNTSTTREAFEVGGYRQDTTAVDAIRFMMSSGNISTGFFVLYGLEA